jgi:hypothetical protein
MFLALNASGAVIRGSATGIADITPDFWSIEYLSGTGTQSVAQVELTLPGPGFFDFDGTGNYNNHTSPIFSSTSTGLAASDVTFTFAGVHPSSLFIDFAPGSFQAGDELRFAAGLDGLGSQLGGAVGAYGGTQLRVTFDDGSSGSALLVTNTSVNSTGFLDTADTPVPEPSTGLLAIGIACAMGIFSRRASRPQSL